MAAGKSKNRTRILAIWPSRLAATGESTTDTDNRGGQILLHSCAVHTVSVLDKKYHLSKAGDTAEETDFLKIQYNS